MNYTDVFSMPLDLPLSIDIGQSESTTLTFTPNVIGLYDEDISIRHNGPADQNIINVLADVFSPNYLRIIDKTVLREQTSRIISISTSGLPSSSKSFSSSDRVKLLVNMSDKAKKESLSRTLLLR